MIRPTWKHPRPYGAPAATDSASTIAAPLLAGFSITLIAQVIDSRDSVRWPDVVFILLAGASVAMLAAVQSGFWARQYYVRPEELEDWWPDIGNPRRWANVRQDQWAHARLHELWCRRFRRAYRLGILLLLAGLGFALVPSASGGDFGWPRALAIGVVGAGFLGELLWIGASRMLHFEAGLELRRDRRAAEARRDELAETPDDPDAARALAILTRRLADRPGKQLAFVAHSTGVTSDQVATATGLPAAEAGKILARLTELGELRHFDGNGRVSYRLPGSS